MSLEGKTEIECRRPRIVGPLRLESASVEPILQTVETLGDLIQVDAPQRFVKLFEGSVRIHRKLLRQGTRSRYARHMPQSSAIV